MVTGFDIWGHDASLRRHWKGRFVAFVIDAATSFIPTSLALYFLNVEDIVPVGLMSSIVFYLVSSIPEALTGASLGKRAMGFRVHSTAGDSLGGRACIRNIPRFFWFVLPPLDFAVGMATRGDPRQRLFDKLAGTKVVHVSEADRYEKAMKPLPENEEGDRDEKTYVGNVCRECGDNLFRLPDEKFQCENCGLIQ